MRTAIPNLRVNWKLTIVWIICLSVLLYRVFYFNETTFSPAGDDPAFTIRDWSLVGTGFFGWIIFKDLVRLVRIKLLKR